jgi:signal transduction histidine kinase
LATLSTSSKGALDLTKLADAGSSSTGAVVPAADLAELIGAFNEVTTRLQATHETLNAEVSRLKGELSQANQQLRRARELAALGEMAAGIAHEVRNPLGSIGLYASALEEDLLEQPNQREMAMKISRAVRSLDAVVSDVLTFSRDLRIDAVVVSVEELLELSLATCEDLIQRAAVKVQLPDEAELARTLLCDPSLMQQAMGNVLRNAIEAMEMVEGERAVTIVAAPCEARNDQGRPCAMIAMRICDGGPGVSDDTLKRIFNPFFTTRKTGTGLGLPIVHRIVDAHCGRVTVRNRKEGGAEVELMLPAASPEVKQPTTSTPAETVGSSYGGDQ